MRKYSYFIFIVVVALLSSCKDKHKGYKKQKEDFYSQLLTFEDSKKSISNNCFVQFNLKVITKNDTLFNERILDEIKEVNNNGGLIEALSYLKENEKGSFIFPFCKLEETFKQKLSSIPLKDSSNFVYQITIDKIFNQKEYSMNKKVFLTWIRQTKNLDYKTFENYLIQQFLKDEAVHFKKSESGLYFKIIAKNEGPKIKSGDLIQLSYSGGPLIKNKPFTDSLITQEFNVGQELQVIKAIEKTLLYLCKGDSAVIVANSSLAFGDKGSSTGIIPPYSPVVYYLKVGSEMKANKN